MLIDAHLHVYAKKVLPEKYGRCLNAYISRNAVLSRSSHEIPSHIWEMVDDRDGKRWEEDMKRVGIDIGVNMTLDWGSAEGWGEEAPLSIEEINRYYCDLAKKYQGKLYTFAGVHPRRHNAVEILEKAVKEWGAKGLKLNPPLGFYPNDKICYPLYEKCVELGVPVTIHTGHGVFLQVKYCNPLYMDEPAKDFPELQFIMAHAGGGIGHFWEDAVTVARTNPNINLDLAEIAPSVIKGGTHGNKGKYKDHIPMFLDMLDIFRNLTYGCTNILFGTDYPCYPMEILEAWVDLFKNLPEVAAQYGYDFSQEEADLICYKNAARILKLDIDGM
ncbi:amidohydrolase family protein [Chloroflexota bacterium]